MTRDNDTLTIRRTRGEGPGALTILHGFTGAELFELRGAGVLSDVLAKAVEAMGDTLDEAEEAQAKGGKK